MGCVPAESSVVVVNETFDHYKVVKTARIVTRAAVY